MPLSLSTLKYLSILSDLPRVRTSRLCSRWVKWFVPMLKPAHRLTFVKSSVSVLWMFDPASLIDLKSYRILGTPGLKPSPILLGKGMSFCWPDSALLTVIIFTPSSSHALRRLTVWFCSPVNPSSVAKGLCWRCSKVNASFCFKLKGTWKKRRLWSLPATLVATSSAS